MSFLARRHSPRLENAFLQVDPWMTMVAFVLPLLLAWPLISHDLPAGPSAGFLLGLQTLGILPPPGYPLYLLLARGWSALFPFGDAVWRAGLFSACLAAGTTVLFYRLGRLLQFPASVALSGSLALLGSGFILPQALVVGPWSLHLFLLTACLVATLLLLLAEPWPNVRREQLAWGFLCGLTAGQEPASSFWILLLLGLVLVWRKAGFRQYVTTLLAVLAGLVLPYLYLPVRVFSAQAYINTDFVPQWSELIQSHNWGTAVRWAWWYLTARHAPSAPALQLTTLVRSGWNAYSLLAVLISGLGCLSSFWGLWVQRTRAHINDRILQLRLVIGVLPLAALAASWLLLPAGRHPWLGMTALAMACWSLIGLDYCYFRLGHSDEAVAKNKNTFATWFGLLVIVLLPCLAWWQTYLSLKPTLVRTARNSNLAQARMLVAGFPPSSVLIFPTLQESCLFSYLRAAGAGRPDLLLASVNTPWPGKYYGGRASLEFLGKTPAEREGRRQNYLNYWQDGLRETIASGTPVFLLVRPWPPGVVLPGWLGNLALDPQPWSWYEWDEQGRRQAVGVFRLKLPSARPDGRRK